MIRRGICFCSGTKSLPEISNPSEFAFPTGVIFLKFSAKDAFDLGKLVGGKVGLVSRLNAVLDL